MILDHPLTGRASDTLHSGCDLVRESMNQIVFRAPGDEIEIKGAARGCSVFESGRVGSAGQRGFGWYRAEDVAKLRVVVRFLNAACAVRSGPCNRRIANRAPGAGGAENVQSAVVISDPLAWRSASDTRAASFQPGG